MAHAVVAARSAIDPDAVLARVARTGVTAHTLADPTYPAPLAEIYDAPPALYTRGAFAPDDE